MVIKIVYKKILTMCFIEFYTHFLYIYDNLKNSLREKIKVN